MGPGSRREALSREERLRRRAEFQRCYRQGRRRRGGAATLFFAPNDVGHPRLGVTASRKVGGAVTRQKLKRRSREIYRRWSERGRMPPYDLVIHLNPMAAQMEFEPLRKELARLFLGLLPPSP